MAETPPLEIVGVGIATIDVIQEVDAFPNDPSAHVKKDTVGERYVPCTVSNMRSLMTLCCGRGGNVTNALAIAAQLGCACHWLGTTTDPTRDGDAAFVSENLGSFGINMRAATVLPSGAMPVSYILASKATGSRTIVHHRDLPELGFESFCEAFDTLVMARKLRTSGAQRRGLWVHFEGRNLDNVEQMMQLLRERHDSAAISIEIEALRNDWGHLQRLLQLADVAFVSKDYIRRKLGLRDAAAFFDHLRTLWGDGWRPRAIICPWGCDGVYYWDVNTQTEHHLPTASLANAVDSVGAGDSFIGAALAAFAHHQPLHATVRTACRVATAKCTQQGFRLPSELRDEVVASLLARTEN